MEDALVEVEMIPAEPERLGEPQPMREAHEEEGGVTEAPAAFASCLNKPLDFFGSEVLAFAWPAGRAGFANFSLYASWGGSRHRYAGECFQHS